uniref:Uncharacterized protein n=1 Tax=Anopheles culicifacies TaxID=139723 RepID=A0A182MP62_9DIPT
MSIRSAPKRWIKTHPLVSDEGQRFITATSPGRTRELGAVIILLLIIITHSTIVIIIIIVNGGGDRIVPVATNFNGILLLRPLGCIEATIISVLINQCACPDRCLTICRFEPSIAAMAYVRFNARMKLVAMAMGRRELIRRN